MKSKTRWGFREHVEWAKICPDCKHMFVHRLHKCCPKCGIGLYGMGETITKPGYLYSPSKREWIPLVQLGIEMGKVIVGAK